MQSRDIKDKITGALNTVKVIDPHCHLDPAQPSARSLADIVLYHHVWIELVSSGMGQNEVTEEGLPHELADPRMEPFERVRRSIPYLNNIRNTTVGLLLRWLLKDLYGFDDDISQTNVEKLYALVNERGKDRNWEKRVFEDFCGIERCISVASDGRLDSERILKASEALRQVNIMDGKNSPRLKLLQMEASFGREIRKASDFRDFLITMIGKLPIGELKFLGAWVLPYMTDELADEDNVSRILGKAVKGDPLNHTELGSVTYFGMVSSLENLRKYDLKTIQLIVGAEVLLPHRPITHWSESFCGAAGRLACRFEDFNFNISSASDLYTQDIAVLAKHIPNISVAGYWWHTLYPFYIKKSLETRLDMIPANKIIGFFSDAYHCEWCYPKLRLVKQILGEILVERVEKGWYTLDTAIEIIHTILYDTPKTIYCI
jgi:glucuronate isomerase